MSIQPISAVPTNIITGFLGVGKTTFIQALLEKKPTKERWAVLVNEFGEVGIDEALFAKQQDSDIYIKQVPGGCMCCASGLFMQVALNQLLAHAKPHRLLIEPTGLGHPKEVLSTLASEHYREVLDIRATLTLVDARKLSEQRYRDHPVYQEQLLISDAILATKSDLYQANELSDLDVFLKQLDIEQKPVQVLSPGQVDMSLLSSPSAFSAEFHHSHAHHHGAEAPDIGQMLKDEGRVKIANEGEGFYSYGWIYPPSKWFDFDKTFSMLSCLDVERLKAVLITNKGIFGFNLVDGVLNCVEMDESEDSRLEFIVDDKSKAEQLAESLESLIFQE